MIRNVLDGSMKKDVERLGLRTRSGVVQPLFGERQNGLLQIALVAFESG